MITNYICPFCGTHAEDDKKVSGFVKNGSGRFQSKLLYHIECAEKRHLIPAIDLDTGEVMVTAVRRTYIE